MLFVVFPFSATLARSCPLNQLRPPWNEGPLHLGDGGRLYQIGSRHRGDAGQERSVTGRSKAILSLSLALRRRACDRSSTSVGCDSVPYYNRIRFTSCGPPVEYAIETSFIRLRQQSGQNVCYLAGRQTLSMTYWGGYWLYNAAG